MKKMMIAAACLLALAACKQRDNNAMELALEQQRDSLTRIIEQKDNEIDDNLEAEKTKNIIIDNHENYEINVNIHNLYQNKEIQNESITIFPEKFS